MSEKKLKKPKQNYGPGNVLRSKREEYEWSVEAVAEALHLSSDVVKSIEADRYDELPGATYVLGYWRSYSRLLGIDIEDTIDANKRNLTVVVPETRSLHMANAYHPVKRSGFLIWISILALLASLVYYSWQQNFYGLFDGFGDDAAEQAQVSETNDENVVVNSVQTNESDSVLRKIEKTPFQNKAIKIESTQVDQSSAASNTQDGVTSEPLVTTTDSGLLMQNPQDNSLPDENTAVASSNKAEPVVEEPPTKLLAQDGLVMSGEDGLEQNSQSAEETTTEEATANNEQPKTQSVSATSGDGSLLVLTLSKDSWLDIRDRTNKRLVYATEKAGDTITVNGTPPFYLYIGTPSGVSVKYKGENVAFETHKSGLFARFKLDDTLEYL